MNAMNAMTSPTSSTSTSALRESWVEKLLHQMLLSYGKKFTDQWAATSTDDLVAHWSAQLAGYSGAEIRHGLAALETREWPPTLPEFKKLCRPPVDPLVAYYEAIAGAQARHAGEHGKWSHPAIYWAAMPLASDLLQQPYSQIKPRWERALAAELARDEWPAIPRPALALAAPGESTASRESAVKAIQKLLVMVGRPKVDNLAWAKRILERDRAGDKHLLPVQVQFAREAMAAAEA
jgi:hypothetical protein